MQSFTLKRNKLSYDEEKSMLVCNDRDKDGKKLWVKKIHEVGIISNIIEDDKNFYLACESGESSGSFLAIEKSSGNTVWFIPGKSFLQVFYMGFLYIIFVDDNEQYYLLKVERKKGRTKWHYRILNDLSEYHFSRKEIKLTYSSGKTECLSPATGKRKK